MALPEQPSSDIDQQTLRTIMELQLEDLELLASRSKGKQREGTTTDAHVAMQIYIEDLQTCDTTMTNREAAQAVAELCKQELQVAQDRRLAKRLSVGQKSSASHLPGRDRRRVRFEEGIPQISRVPGMTVAASALVPLDLPPAYPGHQCVACKEDRQLVVTAPCRHRHQYCRACIVKLFELAIQDDSLFPPRCDGSTVPIDSARPFLSLDLLRRYENKLEERKADDRTYCHNTFCAVFIPPSEINDDVGRCTACNATTCTFCKSKSHSGGCPTDAESLQLKRMAERKQWQQCYACKAYIQLETGCNHITVEDVVVEHNSAMSAARSGRHVAASSGTSDVSTIADAAVETRTEATTHISLANTEVQQRSATMASRWEWNQVPAPLKMPHSSQSKDSDGGHDGNMRQTVRPTIPPWQMIAVRRHLAW
ncbi:uncharacterized protein LTR77_004125 [Saxophila tyrrhenica]|uniref:IBR domain-containing protein n=1 Tax=Saxophila tyrrhenica TaxID=1690608 RepID=A0AAV9PBW6_9PEZI|nr:hypothetical protein LTR77_004125 [Saxophila tyrrhenica]